VIVGATRERDAADDPVGVEVDDGQVVPALHVDHDRVRHRVVLDVARLPSESDRRDSVAGGVEHRFDAAGLVGDEYVVFGGVVGEPVRVLACRGAGEDPPVRPSSVIASRAFVADA